MHQRFESQRNVYVDIDTKGLPRQLLHTHAPISVGGSTPQLAAALYLSQFGDLLGLGPTELKNLALSPSSTVGTEAVEYRFAQEKSQGDMVTVAYQQTALSLPVWRAGLAVQLKLDPFRVVSAQSTAHAEVEAQPPKPDAVQRAENTKEDALRGYLGLSEQLEASHVPDPGKLRIEKRRLVVYRYRASERTSASSTIETRDGGHSHGVQTLPLPPVSTSIKEGHHYVCVEIDFALPVRPAGLLHWVALLEVESMSVLYLRAFVDDVSGMVFETEPSTDNGGPAPTATAANLNPVRVSRTLAGLSAPSGGVQTLAGANVTLSDVESPTVAAPTEPTGTDFNFGARTDGFAAVNAYYHCDKFFRLLDSMGFTRASYFGGTTFPSPVDHRGSINASNGVEVNAHCVGTSGGGGILRTTFALANTADTANPIGIACDHRVVLHELGGHGVLYNHVSSPNFGFAHSAGDSIAAILSDPGSQASDRFVTFPWVSIGRRHDRTPAAGWGYAGSIALNPFDFGLDAGGYNNEQILSSAHFRLYRSIGGDSADLAMKRFAARMAVYLILRGIQTLTPSTNPSNASGWVTALLTADLGNWVSENITGGAYGKVIRWAFEKQGLFQPSGAATPNNNVGAPPAVDVYIDDGRGGEYAFQPVWWNCQKIWNRRANDGGTTHEEPVTNRTNYAYVKIKNRGTQQATGVTVRAYHANPAGGLAYPIDWVPMTTAQLSASNVAANNAAEITVGPFAWIPTHVGHECIFMVVSATGDPSNTNNISTGSSIPEWRLVPNDNNIGQRNVFPVSGGGTTGLAVDFNRFSFEIKNPHPSPAPVEVRTTLPKFLTERGWSVAFTSRGGAAFPLGPGESRDVAIRLVPGADFERTDVEATEDRTIEVHAYADGILVGGMSYSIDPNLKPPRGHGDPVEPDKCTKVAEELVNCLDKRQRNVRKVRVRKINVDLFFDADCDDECE